MKLIKRVCDRCKQEIKGGIDDAVLDFLEREYPGEDICPDCDLLMTLGASLGKWDIKNSSKPGTALRTMLERYE